MLWFNHWTDVSPHFVTWYGDIVLNIPIQTWFHKLKLSRKIIFFLSHLRFSYILISAYFYLFLSDSLLCTRHITSFVCTIFHVFFDCLSISIVRESFINLPFPSYVRFNFCFFSLFHITICYIVYYLLCFY